jgi:hypothetical protein
VALRVYFARDFGGYVDNLLAPEKRASSPNYIRANFCIVAVVMATAATHCLSTVHNHLCTVTWQI